MFEAVKVHPMLLETLIVLSCPLGVKLFTGVRSKEVYRGNQIHRGVFFLGSRHDP